MSRFVQHPAYQAGLRARITGAPRTDNPYSDPTDRHRWDNAWKNEDKRQSNGTV